MNIRLYFNRSYQPLSAPARITVSNFEDRISKGSALPISCEMGEDGSWQKRWKEVPDSERAKHLCFALHKLARQQLLIKDALEIKHDDSVRLQIPGLIVVEVKKNIIGPHAFWYLSLEFSHGGSYRQLGWNDLRNLQPFPYEATLREAIVIYLRKEARLKADHGLKETARFEDLELALKQTGKRFRSAVVAVNSLEALSSAS